MASLPGDRPDWSSPLAAPPQLLKQAVVSNAFGGTVTVQPTPGIHALAMTSNGAAANFGPTSIIGNTSSLLYWAAGSALGATYSMARGQVVLPIAWSPDVDARLDIRFPPYGGGVDQTVTVWGIFDTAAIFPWNSPGQVDLERVGGIGVTLGQGIKGVSVPVAPATDYVSTPWQRAATAVRISNTLAAGATATIAAGLAGNRLSVFAAELTFDAGGATDTMDLEGTDGTFLASFSAVPAAGALVHGIQLFALPLATAVGLRLHNQAAGAQTVRGTVLYTQVPN